MLHQDVTGKDVIVILRRRAALIFLIVVFGGVAGYLVARVLPKRFTSQTLVLVQQTGLSKDFMTPVNPDASNQRMAGMQQQILSRSRLEAVIQELGLYSEAVGQTPMEALVERLRSAITITPIQPMPETRAQNLPGFYISVVASEPHAAQNICAKITSMFLEENARLRRGEATDTTQFLGQQLQDAKAKLDEQDARLAAFQRQNLGSLPEESQANLSLLSGLNSQLEAATEALDRAQQDKSFTESMLSAQVAAWRASQTGENPETYEQQLQTLQAQLTLLQSKYTDVHPDVIKAKNDLANLQKKIATSEQQKKTEGTAKIAKSDLEPAQIQQLRAQIEQDDQVIRERTQQEQEIQRQIKMYQARVQSSPAVEQEFKLITRDRQAAQDFYNDLLKKRDQSAMATDLEQSKQGDPFRVLDPANLPAKPSFPKKSLFTGGGLGAGMFLAFGIVLFLEMQDTSIRSERDVEVVLSLPVLAMIPVIARTRGKGQARPTLIGSST